MDTVVLLALMVALAYIIFYLRGRYYMREAFQDGGRNCRTVLDTTSQQYKPYMTNQDKYGDFEADFIYQNEGGYDPTKEAINTARRRFPFDWSQLPPSSSLFQAQQALFVKDNTATAAPYALETFTDIESKKVLPPDGTEDQAETDALKAYKPVATADMKSVDEKSVKELIEKIYGDKGLVAKVAKDANNVFEVYEVQEKNPKIVYEDEVQTTSSMQSNALNPMVDPTEMLVTPNAVSDVVPYASGENTRSGRQSYSNYNPNLEGIFGPKMQWQQWG
jgi:ABC-type sulfate transport system substrate-binding protein